MNYAYITFLNILVMMIYAVPGFLLVKTKLVKPEGIAGFAVLLMYVCQPCLSYYAMTKVDFEGRILKNMLYTVLISAVIMATVIMVFYAVTRKKQQENVGLRVANLGSAMGNCTFIGLPLVEALLPEYPEASLYSVAFFLSMGVIGWTISCFIISQDRKYIDIKKVIVNPATLGLLLTLPFFIFNYELPDIFSNAINFVGRMSTPLCMMILGMRLATVKVRDIIGVKVNYLAIAIKQMIVPLAYLGLGTLLHLEHNLVITLFVCGATPVAAVVLNYTELLGQGQKNAAGLILLSAFLSILTIPLLMLIL